MRKPASSVCLGHQLVLFYRVNGQCTEIVLLCDETEKSGVYSAACKYIKQSLFQLASNSKGITKPQYLQDLDQFLMSAYLDNIMGTI